MVKMVKILNNSANLKMGKFCAGFLIKCWSTVIKLVSRNLTEKMTKIMKV